MKETKRHLGDNDIEFTMLTDLFISKGFKPKESARKAKKILMEM